jgi:branched-chain amino acid transport system substrate-binding protein
VGIIASLSGPAQAWGLATVRSAQVVADYYNDRGGFELNGERIRIELIVCDDEGSAAVSVCAAQDLIDDGVRYVIGPLGDAEALAATPVLDCAGAFYIYYGFNQEQRGFRGRGALGMPVPEQSLPILLQQLKQEEAVESVLVMAYGTDEGIWQKENAVSIVKDAGFKILQLSRFDVSEETFPDDLTSVVMPRRVDSVVTAAPDVLILTGCPPAVFVVLVDRLRTGGYTGFICAQNAQDPMSLAKLGARSDRVYFVGGGGVDETRTAYYLDLKQRYLDLAGSWDLEADTKLYALEFILACIQEFGSAALEEPSIIYQSMDEVCFQDPFYLEPHMISIVGCQKSGQARQIQTPIRISRMENGRAVLVAESLIMRALQE